MSALGVIFAILAHAAWRELSQTPEGSANWDFAGWLTFIFAMVAIGCGVAGAVR